MQRRFARRLWVVRVGITRLLLSVAVVATVALLGRDWIEHGIAAAPNAGRMFRPEDDPRPADLRALGIDAQLRVDVVVRAVARLRSRSG